MGEGIIKRTSVQCVRRDR